MNEIRKRQKSESKELLRQTKEQILRMAASGEPVNFYTVSQAAAVSRTFLYKHPELRKLIQDLRTSKLTKQEALREISRLRAELQTLREQQEKTDSNT